MRQISERKKADIRCLLYLGESERKSLCRKRSARDPTATQVDRFQSDLLLEERTAPPTVTGLSP